MNISEVKVKLTAKDITSIINDFAKIKGLNIRNFIINEKITLEGSLKVIITIPFKVSVEIVGVQANKLTVRLAYLNIMKFKIFRFIRNAILKIALKEIKDNGIIPKSDCVEINLKKILKTLPFIDLNLKAINCNEGYLDVTVGEIDFALDKFGEKSENNELESKKDQAKEDIKNIKVNKIEDCYTNGRNNIENNMPKKIKDYSDYIFVLPDIIALICRLLKDSRVKNKTKALIVASCAYLSCPVDILPDKIPFIGKVDDIGIIFFTLNKIIDDVPIEIILENWQGKNEFIVVLKKALDYLTKFTVANNVSKIYQAINFMALE